MWQTLATIATTAIIGIVATTPNIDTIATTPTIATTATTAPIAANCRYFYYCLYSCYFHCHSLHLSSTHRHEVGVAVLILCGQRSQEPGTTIIPLQVINDQP